MTDHTLPDVGPAYDLTIDEMFEMLTGPDRGEMPLDTACSIGSQWTKRRAVRDAILDLNDELNDAGLVVVRESELPPAPTADDYAHSAALDANE